MQKSARAIVSRWTTPLWPATVAGILVGAAIGGAIGGLTLLEGDVSEATALVRIYQPIDPDQIMSGNFPYSSPDSQQNYISGEIAYLNSPGFADAVAKQLNEASPPNLSATQNVQSPIISLSATRADFEDAEQVINAAVKVYSNHLQQQTQERGSAAIQALTAIISRYEDLIQKANEGLRPPIDPAPTLSGVYDITGLPERERLAIEVQTERSAPLQVVQPPTETRVKGAPGWSLGAAGGGLIGGLLALAGALAWRKRVGVVTSPSALEGQIEHVLLPMVRLGALTESSDAYAGLARSLYAQLPAPRSGRILLVGASADSGTEEVARLIAFAAAEHANVRVVHLLDGVQSDDGFESLAALKDGADLTDAATVVIDGGSLDTAPALPDAAEDASQIIIVAMVGRDVNDTVRMASLLARDSDVPISAVCTRHRIRRVRPSRRDEKHLQPAPSADGPSVETNSTTSADGPSVETNSTTSDVVSS